MGSGNRADATLVQVVQNGNRKGSAFGRIGSGTQFVEQAQGIRIGFLQDGNNAGHMGGEGTEALLNALLVANICEYFRKNRKLAAVKCRNMKTGLSHESKQSNGFQADGFTTGIGACDDQKIKILSEMDVNRDYLFRRKERMTSLPDLDIVIRIKNRLRCI